MAGSLERQDLNPEYLGRELTLPTTWPEPWSNDKSFFVEEKFHLIFSLVMPPQDDSAACNQPSKAQPAKEGQVGLSLKMFAAA